MSDLMLSERILYESPANLARLKTILSPDAITIKTIDPDSPTATIESHARLLLDTNPSSNNPEEDNRFRSTAVRYNRIYPHLAFRSKLPVKDDWIQIVLPSYNRDYNLSDFILAFRALGFNLEREYYKLDKLTENLYQLRVLDYNPRFLPGAVGFKIVTELDPLAVPDVARYADYDFTMTDREYMCAWANYLLYPFCYTKKNAQVISMINEPGDSTKGRAVVSVDRHAYFVDNIGLKLTDKRYLRNTLPVEKKLADTILDDLGFEEYVPLGIGYAVRQSFELIPRINELYNLGISEMDIIDLPIVSAIHGLRFKSTCLAYAGELMLHIPGQVTPRS